jgi:hypothetical protein
MDMALIANLTSEDLAEAVPKALFDYCARAHKLGDLSSNAVRALIAADSIESQQKTLLHNSISSMEKMPLPEKEFTINFFRAKQRQSRARTMLQVAVDRVWKGEPIDEVLDSIKAQVDDLTSGRVEVEVHQYRNTVMPRDRERRERMELAPGLQFIDNLAYFQKYFPFGIQKKTTVAITAPTNLGKSIFMTNMIRMATLPANAHTVLYVFSENRAEEAIGRLDAVLLNKPYLSLYTSNLTVDEMQDLTSTKEHSEVFYCRLQLDKFSATDIREAIARVHHEHKIKIDYVFVDSPDHMTGSTAREDYYLDKTQAWIDLKVLAEDLDVGVIGTRPMDEKFRVAKRKNDVEKLTASSGANGQKITRLLDAEIAFHVDDLETATSNHRIATITKLRDGGQVDNERIRLLVTSSLRFIHEDDFARQFGSKEKSAEELFDEP